MTADAPLPFDLAAQLQQQLNVNATAVSCIKTDVIDIVAQPQLSLQSTSPGAIPLPDGNNMMQQITTTSSTTVTTTTTASNAIVSGLKFDV